MEKAHLNFYIFFEWYVLGNVEQTNMWDVFPIINEYFNDDFYFRHTLARLKTRKCYQNLT